MGWQNLMILAGLWMVDEWGYWVFQHPFGMGGEIFPNFSVERLLAKPGAV